MTLLTRRQTTGLILAGAVLPSELFAATISEEPPEHPDIVRVLESALNKRIAPNCQGSFSVVAFDADKVEGKRTMCTIVRLDWPPGTRQRLFASEASSDQAAFQALYDKCIAGFKPAWPGCIV